VKLHVFEDAVTGSEYVLAPELVRSYLPTVSKAGGTRKSLSLKRVTESLPVMHSIYTYNHAYGRGTPISRSACCDWRAWAGCPQALAKKASSVSSESDMERARERIWLVNGQAEILIGPECEPVRDRLASRSHLIRLGQGDDRPCDCVKQGQESCEGMLSEVVNDYTMMYLFSYARRSVASVKAQCSTKLS
jgi:hypothetical protein